MDIIMQGAWEWQLEQMRLEIVAIFEANNIEVPECFQISLLSGVDEEKLKETHP